MAGRSRTGPQGLFHLLKKDTGQTSGIRRNRVAGSSRATPGKADPHSVTEGPAESGQLGEPGAAALSGVVMAMKV